MGSDPHLGVSNIRSSNKLFLPTDFQDGHILFSGHLGNIGSYLDIIVCPLYWVLAVIALWDLDGPDHESKLLMFTQF